MQLAAGKLTKKVFIERPDRTITATGETRMAWKVFGTEPRSAAVIPLAGRELENARQVQSEVTHRIEIRSLPGVNPEMRISWRSKQRRFNIMAVTNPEEADVAMHLLCKEIPWREDIEE